MNNTIEQELSKLRLKLKCGKMLFTVISILLSILFAPICFLLFVFVLLMMLVLIAAFCISMPFIVGYKCIKYDEFEIKDKIGEGNNDFV